MEGSSSDGKLKIAPQSKELVLSDLANTQLRKPPVFENLTSLIIVRCSSMPKLFTVSVAGHLSCLKLLKLCDCEKMVHVLQGDDVGAGNSEKALVLQKLESLVLKQLPRLTSFCEEEVDFGEFPKLKMVRVEDVPSMTTFVKRPLMTPQLKQVYETYITKCWQRDLNQTIKCLHEKLGIVNEVWRTNRQGFDYQSSLGIKDIDFESSS
ncbi:uncharacterized protein LOC129288173 isoform X1 [Prosopis cineraria]|uniref:uncharacterized protein LOC129288173 isoform X1 n=2 Tax=Prosopis cineraria TaxID=364024 RepID=UPI00241069D8|nr:uncharacterized protein LOC129288173 isoform X1 [Prosopis cineraria]XP_054780576.1 uncharacterized protein LOC129288173 isoform X1 [Prosopis cineraria]